MTGASGAETTAGQAELNARGVRPWPAPDADTSPYWAAARQHRLELPRCAACVRFRHPSTSACVWCGVRTARWTPIRGDGVIETFMVDHRNLVPGFDEPYAVAVVELLETAGDVRLVANVQGCALDTIHIGMRVRVAFEEISPDVTLPQFVPVDVAEVRP